MSEELDRMLENYLRREQEDPIRARLQKQADWMAEHEKTDSTRHAELLRAQDSLAYRTSTLEGQANRLAKEVEDTGAHQVDAIKARVKRIDDAVFRLAMIALMALLGGGAVAFVQHAAATAGH